MSWKESDSKIIGSSFKLLKTLNAFLVSIMIGMITALAKSSQLWTDRSANKNQFFQNKVTPSQYV